MMRWKLALAAFEFTVEYKSGSSQRVADELSRMETEGLSSVPEEVEVDDNIPCLVVHVSREYEIPLLPAPVFPRSGPIVHVPDPLDSITLE
jgi:hypothetical protein